ncbi:MAG: YeeE/YedE thiosulfate transporter family protein [Pseudomonadota bacterium]
MTIELLTATFLLAMLMTGLMGFAIQRGATCTVVAMEELIAHRRCTRLVSMLEASLWVACGVLLATALGWSALTPQGYAIGWSTCVGAVLLGLGAFVNRACVVGTVARFGAGDWNYFGTPLGFFLGCAVLHALPMLPQPLHTGALSPVLTGAAWTGPVLAALVLWRVGDALWRRRGASAKPFAWLSATAWTPGAATLVIGLAFVAVLLLVGEGWAYTDVLAELAHGIARSLHWRGLLLLALFAGALAGGYSAGKFRRGRVRRAMVVQCAIGGFLMGFGSLLIPGSNDGLVLLGLPLLWPHAWLGFVLMCATVVVALLLERRFRTSVLPR